MPKQKIVSPLKDTVSERLLIASILQYGADVFYDIRSILTANDFTQPENQIIFSAYEDLIENQKIDLPDIPTIIHKVNQIDSNAALMDIPEYLGFLQEETISKSNIKPHYSRIYKLSIARVLRQKLYESIEDISSVTGDEEVFGIISKAESPIINFTNSLTSDNDTINLSNEVESYVEWLKEEQPQFLGVPTGYPIFDSCIGGGLRKPGVHVVGARAKIGKSYLCINVAKNVSERDIPVLYLDTELTKDIVLNRYLSLLSGLPTENVEHGGFADNPSEMEKMNFAIQQAQNNDFHYHNVSGMHHRDIISIMRKFMHQKVGINKDTGNYNECLIILDYLKMMNLDHAEQFAEHQYLGQAITDLHNFAITYNIAILCIVQLNRDGITREDQSVIAGSDKIMSLCSSFTIMKNKSAEDYAADPQINGDKKLVLVDGRFGSGLPEGVYINLKTDLGRALITEGDTNSNIQNQGNNVILMDDDDD